jgi:hypothetical protein
VSTRGVVLGGLLLASILAAVAVSRDEGDSVVQAAPRQQSGASNGPGRDGDGGSEPALSESSALPAADPEDWVARLAPRRIDGDLYPLFPAVPRAVQRAATGVEQAPEPSAPALPFKYLGQMVENGEVTLFLSLNDRNIVAKPGDTIDDLYRVESIQGGVVEFTYLPLKQKQTLPVGERS